MNSTNQQSAVYLTPRQVDPQWHIVATGDLNGDGQKDLVWERADGALAVWLMNGLVATQSVRLNPSSVSPSWRVVGCADFNGDGKADILWQNVDRRLAVWFMDGSVRTGLSYINIGQIPDYWRVVGTWDFNGDGHPGLIWQHIFADRVIYWEMDGTDHVGGGSLGLISPDPGWKIVGPR